MSYLDGFSNSLDCCSGKIPEPDTAPINEGETLTVDSSNPDEVIKVQNLPPPPAKIEGNFERINAITNRLVLSLAALATSIGLFILFGNLTSWNHFSNAPADYGLIGSALMLGSSLYGVAHYGRLSAYEPSHSWMHEYNRDLILSLIALNILLFLTVLFADQGTFFHGNAFDNNFDMAAASLIPFTLVALGFSIFNAIARNHRIESKKDHDELMALTPQPPKPKEKPCGDL